MRRNLAIIAAALIGIAPVASNAEPAPVICTIMPDGESARVVITNPLNADASCQVNCKFSTAVYDDNPQIICAKPVPAGKQVEMCILKAAGNKLLKLVEAAADCRKP